MKDMMDRTAGHQINRALHFTFYVVLSIVLVIGSAQSAGEQFVIAQVQYGGGGDWYGDQTTISNWLKILRTRTDIEAAEERVIVKLTDRNLYQYPMLYIVGHGNIRFTKEEVEALRFYLTHGGFLFVNDDYGLDGSFRREIRRVFHDQSLHLYRIHISSITVSTIFPMGFRKFMNMMVNPRKVSGYSTKAEWPFITSTVRTLGMV